MPPAWARTARDSPNSAPIDSPEIDAAYARMAAFVARSFPRAAGIETWNEPNIQAFWQPLNPEPERYLRLHRAAARSIRAAVPGLKVVLGGLAGALRESPQVMSPQRFLKRMFAAGLTPADYDALAIHPYPEAVDGKVTPLESGSFSRQWADFRLGYKWRDPDARIWVTETGITTTGPTAVSEQRQAGVVAALVRKQLDMPEVDAVYVHTQYEPRQFPADSDQTGFGVLRARRSAPGAAKPVFCALNALVANAVADGPVCSRR